MPEVWLMITPGQASRIACWVSLLTLPSQDGRCPLSGACWRRWMCMMLAPGLNAALASRAICSGVTGTLCCFGSVSTPFSAQVMTALSLMMLVSRCDAGMMVVSRVFLLRAQAARAAQQDAEGIAGFAVHQTGAAIARIKPCSESSYAASGRIFLLSKSVAETGMPYKDLLLSLANYPDTTPQASVDLAADFAAAAGAKLSATACEIKI